MKDIDSIRQFLKQASSVEIFLVSFFLLPFISNAWVTVFERIGLPLQNIQISLYLTIGLYILFIILLISATFRGRKRELAKNQILGYLESKNKNMVSFDRIRERFSRSYDDRFLESVIDTFPKEIRRAKLKGGRNGMARIVEESDADES